MEGNFSVQKNKIPFTAIGADHALEQENKNIKVLGGVKGLLQNDSALVRFGLISSVLNQICDEFYYINGVEKETLNERITNNTSKLLVTLENLEVTFEKEHDDIYNIVTKSVLPTTAKNEILSHFDIGQELYSNFLKERIHGEMPIWSPLKKRNIGSFKSIEKRLTRKLEGKVIEMREDKSLLRRLLIVSQKRDDIDSSSLISKYEFSAVPRSLFTYDGKLLPCTNKSVISISY